MGNDSLILGGDLNFSLGSSKCWVSKETSDPLSIFFLEALDNKGFIDIDPINLNPTRQNCQVGEENIAKMLDRFLVSENLVLSLSLLRK